MSANEESYQPTNAHSLIRVPFVRVKPLCILGYQKCALWRFWSDCANAHAELNHRWTHIFWRCGSNILYPLDEQFTSTKTSLYNFDPLKPHFYKVRTGVYRSIHYFTKNIDCGYSLEPPREAVLTSTHSLCFEKEYEKYQFFYLKNFLAWL